MTPYDDRLALGRVAAPPEHESTSGVFYFWVDRAQSVERTQIVTTESTVGGRLVKFVGIVQEVYRRSRQKDVGEEAARFDGNAKLTPPFESEGVTFAEVAILRTEPVAHTPPTEESPVYLADAESAAKGYGMDRMKARLDIGLLRNGGTQFAGRAAIDLAFLLGENGGHLNVNGIAGLGTKSTLLLTMNWLLLRECRRQKLAAPGDPRRLQCVPVIFNVKNFDLFFIDRWNTEYRRNEREYQSDWRSFGVDDPKPFENPKFFAPQQPKLTTPVSTGGRSGGVMPYSWSLSDIIEQRLFVYLFSDDDVQDPNFGGIVGEMEEWLTFESDAGPKLGKDRPQTFADLLEYFRDNRDSLFGDYVKGTKGKLLRRLKYVVMEGDGVLRRTDNKGSPLKIPSAEVDSPIVVDLYGIHQTPSLQRFVVAAVFHQIQQTQSAKQVRNLKYLITLDELNRFAPKDSRDPITQKLETVASEGRSQGIILFGAQQQASLVKPRVIENAAVRAIGRSGTLELGAEVWKFLNKSARDAAAQLQPDEKLIYQPSFREPMLAKIPFPPFALSENDAEPAGVAGPANANGSKSNPMRGMLEEGF
jgi:uncharacterized protein